MSRPINQGYPLLTQRTPFLSRYNNGQFLGSILRELELYILVFRYCKLYPFLSGLGTDAETISLLSGCPWIETRSCPLPHLLT